MVLNREHLETLHRIIENSIEILYRDDSILISKGGLEQSLSFRLAIYINDAIREIDWLSGLQLDIEYNKNGLEPKRTPRRPNGARPDIIIHSRGNNNSNILVIEVKGWWNKESRIIDRIKLEDFTHQEGEFRYALGVFLDFNKEGCAPLYYSDY